MAISKKNTAGKKKIVDQRKSILVAANEDTGFKSYMSDILTSSEFDLFIKDPQRRDLVIEAYKKYLKTIEQDKKIPF
tara:strand:+ start:73 stop:303 length:231 start_codon:yes stop_codon:yes gene_type:complete